MLHGLLDPAPIEHQLAAPRQQNRFSHSASSFVHDDRLRLRLRKHKRMGDEAPYTHRHSAQRSSFTGAREDASPSNAEPPKEGGEAEQQQEAKDEEKEGEHKGDADDKEGEAGEDVGKEHGGHKDIGSVTVEEEETLNLGPSADVLPLCEDLNYDSVHTGDSCWSTCDGQCPNDVLAQGEGLAFDFDEIGPGHPGCTSHFECVGNKDRVLCHAVQAVEQAGMSELSCAIAVLHPAAPKYLRQATWKMFRRTFAISHQKASAHKNARPGKLCDYIYPEMPWDFL